MKPSLKTRDSVLRALGPSPRILLIRLRSLGDVVLMTPALEVLSQIRPDARIDVAVEPPFSEALYGHRFIHRLIEIRRQLHNTHSDASADPVGKAPRLLTKIQAVREIRRTRYEIAWNLHGGSTSAWLTALSGARWRIGCRTFRNRWAYNLRLPDSAEILGRKNHHTVERTLAWLNWLDGRELKDFAEAPAAAVVVSETARRAIDEKLKKRGLNPRAPYAVVQPAAVFATKEWMPDRFAAVGDFVASRGFQIVLTGSPDERARLEEVRSHMQSAAVTMADLGVQELMAVIAGASLYLGNDSGPAHLAAALNKPVIVLFGSSNSIAWSPWKTRSVVVQNSFDCNPCPGYRCLKFAEPECIKSITVEQVKDAVNAVLA